MGGGVATLIVTSSTCYSTDLYNTVTHRVRVGGVLASLVHPWNLHSGAQIPGNYAFREKEGGRRRRRRRAISYLEMGVDLVARVGHGQGNQATDRCQLPCSTSRDS